MRVAFRWYFVLGVFLGDIWIFFCIRDVFRRRKWSFWVELDLGGYCGVIWGADVEWCLDTMFHFAFRWNVGVSW